MNILCIGYNLIHSLFSTFPIILRVVASSWILLISSFFKDLLFSWIFIVMYRRLFLVLNLFKFKLQILNRMSESICLIANSIIVLIFCFWSITSNHLDILISKSISSVFLGLSNQVTHSPWLQSVLLRFLLNGWFSQDSLFFLLAGLVGKGRSFRLSLNILLVANKWFFLILNPWVKHLLLILLRCFRAEHFSCWLLTSLTESKWSKIESIVLFRIV